MTLGFKLKPYEATELANALSAVSGYLTDNACCDPDCCTPLYDYEEYQDGLEVLARYGIEVSDAE